MPTIPTYTVLTHRDVERARTHEQEFALAVLQGLSRTRKSLPSRYFYDDEGSRLFQRITELDEYYPTGAERRIFERHRDRLADIAGGEPFNLIDLGSGDGRKTNVLLEHLLERGETFRYMPIDISEAAIDAQVSALGERYPNLDVQGVVADYLDALLWHSHRSDRRNFLLFMGSNVGNFHRSEARVFLRSVWTYLQPDERVLVGFDLKKDLGRMVRAYNDAQGVTSAFNMNLLTRINRELGGDFDLTKFQHYANYDLCSGAMESYLVSLERQTVYIEAIGQSFDFEPFEPIHTEYSYKFLPGDIEALARDTGFAIEDQLYDDDRTFVDSIWRVVKG